MPPDDSRLLFHDGISLATDECVITQERAEQSTLMSDSGAAHASRVNQGKEVWVCWPAYVSVLCVVKGRTILAVWINIGIGGCNVRSIQ